MQNYKDMNLVLSTDAKPRLKWTPELHQSFVEAVNHLGGADKATPKSLMRVMGITGLTLYHLKSHLQKFRLGKSQQSESNAQVKLEEMKRKDGHLNGETSDGCQNHNMNDMKISEALEMQLEVQKRLQEQIEVQRHLQLRIEAQGKYLQRVLRKAQETISGYGYCSEAVEEAKAELSELASMVSSGCQSSSLSDLTDSTELNFKAIERDEMRVRRMCSIESSLTSSQSSEEAPRPKKRKGKEKEKQQSSSVSEGDCKRLTMQKSDEKHQEFKIVDLNDAQFDDSEIGTPSQLIEYL